MLGIGRLPFRRTFSDFLAMMLTRFPTLTLRQRDYLSFTLRSLVGSVLGIAAVSKLFSIYKLRSISVGPWSIPDPFASLIVFLELSIALLLMAGAWSRLTINITIGLFVLFCCLLAFMTVSGASSCGCLGEREVSPLVMLAFDFTVLVVLCVVHGIHRHTPGKGHRLGPVCLAISAIVCSAVAFFHPTVAEVKASTGGYSAITSPFPVAAVARGDWCIVLYRTSCSHCQEAMGDWIDQSLIDQEVNDRRWIFIDVGNSRDLSLIDFSKHKVLHAAHEMPRVRTPLILFTRDGKIVHEFESPAELIQHAESGL